MAAGNKSKRVVKVAMFIFTERMMHRIATKIFGSWDYYWLCNSILNKTKFYIPPFSNHFDVLTSSAEKGGCFGR